MTRTFLKATNPDHTAFYVSAIHGARSFLIAGPYPTHDDALAMRERVRQFACATQPGVACFAFWGTCGTTNPEGVKVAMSAETALERCEAFEAGRA